MSTIFLVRHAACEGIGRRLNGRAAGVRLTCEGRAEAERLAMRLEKYPIALVMTSPRERCVETADAFAGKVNIEMTPDLDEVDFGAWTGRTFSALAEDPEWRRWNDSRSQARAPGGEGIAEVQRRMDRALGAAIERAAGRVVVLVSHAEPIRAALASILGFSLDAWAKLDISPASVSRLTSDGAALRIGSINETAS